VELAKHKLSPREAFLIAASLNQAHEIQGNETVEAAALDLWDFADSVAAARPGGCIPKGALSAHLTAWYRRTDALRRMERVIGPFCCPGRTRRSMLMRGDVIRAPAAGYYWIDEFLGQDLAWCEPLFVRGVEFEERRRLSTRDLNVPRLMLEALPLRTADKVELAAMLT